MFLNFIPLCNFDYFYEIVLPLGLKSYPWFLMVKSGIYCWWYCPDKQRAYCPWRDGLPYTIFKLVQFLTHCWLARTAMLLSHYPQHRFPFDIDAIISWHLCKKRTIFEDTFLFATFYCKKLCTYDCVVYIVLFACIFFYFLILDCWCETDSSTVNFVYILF